MAMVCSNFRPARPGSPSDLGTTSETDDEKSRARLPASIGPPSHLRPSRFFLPFEVGYRSTMQYATAACRSSGRDP